MTSQTEAPTRKNKAVVPPPPDRPVARARAPGHVEAQGRDGQVLSRKRTAHGDIFHISPAVIPDGWDYQWNPYTVMGEMQVSSQIAMAENGWRPVPAERHPGMFMPEGHKGPVIRDGLILEERPMSLTLEARAEEKAKAKAQQRDAKETLGLTAKLPGGYSDDTQYRGVGVDVKTTLTPMSDSLRPQLEIAND